MSKMNKGLFDGVVSVYVKEAMTTSLENVINRIRSNTVDKIYEYVEDLPEYEMFELIQDHYCDCIHRMEELDDEFAYLSPSEVLEQLGDINLRDEYFSADTCQSSDDFWDLLDGDVSMDQIANDIYDGELDDFRSSTIEEILKTEKELIERVQEEFKIYERARKLFDIAMNQDPKAVVAALWSINM